MDATEFATRIVKCSRQEFDNFLETCNSTDRNKEDPSEDVVVGICDYLKMNSEERRQAWVNEQEAARHLDFRAAHLNFVANPCTATLNVPGFRTCLIRLAEEHIELIGQQIAQRPGDKNNDGRQGERLERIRINQRAMFQR